MNIQQMMQQAQKLQKQLQEMQAKMQNKEVIGIAGGGLVKIVATVKGVVKEVAIDDSLMELAEKEMLQDLLVAAFKNAKDNADGAMSDEMKNMGIPPEVMGSMPF